MTVLPVAEMGRLVAERGVRGVVARGLFVLEGRAASRIPSRWWRRLAARLVASGIASRDGAYQVDQRRAEIRSVLESLRQEAVVGSAEPYRTLDYEQATTTLFHGDAVGHLGVWQKDPLLPDTSAADIAPGDSYADVRSIWELSRCHWLLDGALDVARTGDATRVKNLLGWLAEWRTANPVGEGPNWGCAMEAAIRSVNITLALDVLVASDALEPSSDALDAVDRMLVEHALFIVSHFEWSELHGNHALSDVIGLLAIADWFRGSRFGLWLGRLGERLFDHEGSRQLRPDGAPREGSTSYHALVVELLVHGEALLRANGRQRVRRWITRLAAAASFLEAFAAGGTLLKIGDADDARLLRMATDETSDLRDIIAAARVLAGVDVMTAARGSTQLRVAGSSALDGVSQSGREVPRPDCAVSAFVAGGYLVARRGPVTLATRIGGETLKGRAHAHADLLSVCVSVQDKPLVVDRGNPRYGDDLQRRLRAIGAEAHNGPTLGRGYEQLRGRIPAAMEVPSELESLVNDDQSVEIVASHVGYGVGRRVRRSVALQEDRVLIRDETDGISERLSVCFTFGEGWSLEEATRSQFLARHQNGRVLVSVEFRAGSDFIATDMSIAEMYPRYGSSVRCEVLTAVVSGAALSTAFIVTEV